MAVEGKTIVVDNPEIDEKKNRIFSRRGEENVSPTEIYEENKVDPEDRAIFTVKPYNPIDAQEIKNINKDAEDLIRDKMLDKGLDYYEALERIETLTDKLNEEDLSSEDLKKYASECFNLTATWNSCQNYGKRNRDFKRIFEILTNNISKVENLIYYEDGVRKRYSGEVNYEILTHVDIRIINWLDVELQSMSGLNDSEIMGF